MDDLVLGCDCGEVAGTLSNASPRTTIHLVCYCDDCQTFAGALGRATDMLDPHGGTHIIQCTLAQIAIVKGRDRLRSLRLAPGGLLRWHTGCCNAPIANTISARIPFVGLVRRFVRDPKAEVTLGPSIFRIHGRFARNPPAELAIHRKAPLALLAKVIPRILAAKVRGARTESVFFDSAGRPAVEPYIVA